ncbi:DUF5703 family protein [Georgenia sp. Z1344]|uniref:DUF5703 family protein n=1 Tax=Georgenia sp. Z1344 TaxID=3416706 RepID=UPI003CF487FA
MARAGSTYASDTFYEFRTVTIPPDVGRSDARRLLTAEAEYGRWELARSVLYEGGLRKVVLRRRAMRVASTLAEG